MKYRSLDQVLVERGFINTQQLEQAQRIFRQTGERLDYALIRLGVLREKQVIEAWSLHLGAPVINLQDHPVDPTVVQLLPQSLALRYRMIPLQRTASGIVLAIADPYNLLALDFARRILQSEIEVSLAPRVAIESAIQQNYGVGSTSVADERKFVRQHGDRADESAGLTSDETPDTSAVKFVDAAFRQALAKGASDIHIEPDHDQIVVRMRIDGTLHDSMVGPTSLLPAVVSRIKVLANLDIVQSRLPQDGRLLLKSDGQEVSLRVSTVGTLDGEKVVLRVLSGRPRYGLEDLGFSDKEHQLICRVLNAPHGMLLVTGATGSGKTTTLSAMLQYINNPGIHIFTIEDPVEYRIRRTTQVQADDKIGLSFATGLRAALRQDPDVIMVGEIRDLETAEVGLRAALTGHLVLSTLHTNTAPATVCRLADMGCPLYLIAGSVKMVLSQKLLPKICPECKEEHEVDSSLLTQLELEEGITPTGPLFHGRGCDRCHHSGVLGRTPIYEVMPITDALRRGILASADEADLRSIAIEDGMVTLRQKAIQKAMEGIVSLTEAMSSTAGDGSHRRLHGPRRGASDVRAGTADKRSVSEILEFIRGHYRSLTDVEMAARLGLTGDQVKACIRKLGLAAPAPQPS